jgi:exodeoxyribonuclease VII large subunit
VADLRAPTPSAAAELAVPDIYELKNTINIYQNRFRVSLKRKTELMRLKYEKCMQSRVFRNPTQFINDNLLKIDNSIKKMENNINKKIHNSKNLFVEKATMLDGLSPLKTLTRGYCLAETQNKIIKKAKDLQTNQEITLRFSDGRKQAKII